MDEMKLGDSLSDLFAPIAWADAMYQVVSHSSYHRGQVNTRIRKIGGEPPLTDFIAWIWRGKPSSEWLVSS
jgi:uncharacterized damage-inducible protein DinB